MTEKVLAALDAITTRVLGYRPKDKGLAAKKTERDLWEKGTGITLSIVEGFFL